MVGTPHRGVRGRAGQYSSPAADIGDIPPFNLFPRPRRLAQKRQAGFDRRIELEAPDLNALSHFLPAVIFDELNENLFQGDPVQRIARMFRWRCHAEISFLTQLAYSLAFGSVVVEDGGWTRFLICSMVNKIDFRHRNQSTKQIIAPTSETRINME